MESQSTIRINLNNDAFTPLIDAVRGDSGRSIRCVLYEDTGVFVLNKNARAIYYIEKPDKTIIYNDAGIIDNSVIINLTTQSLAVVGTEKIQVEIHEGDTLITSFVFNINVKENIADKKFIESTNEFTALDEAIKKVGEYKDPIVDFEEATETSEIKSGTKLSRIVSQIKKWISVLDERKVSYVGQIIISTKLSTQEEVIERYGGETWEKIEGRFLLGASSLYPNESTGGAETVTLTQEEIPSHSHLMYTTANDGNSAIRRTFSSDGKCSRYSMGCNTGEAGGGKAHENMPPYKAVYIWERME